MELQEAKRLLEKQLQLLSEKSKDCGSDEAADISEAMAHISEMLISLN